MPHTLSRILVIYINSLLRTPYIGIGKIKSNTELIERKKIKENKKKEPCRRDDPRDMGSSTY